MQFVDVLDPPFSDIACSVISCLVVGTFVPKNGIVTKFCYLSLGGPVIMPHRVQDVWDSTGVIHAEQTCVYTASGDTKLFSPNKWQNLNKFIFIVVL